MFDPQFVSHAALLIALSMAQSGQERPIAATTPGPLRCNPHDVDADGDLDFLLTHSNHLDWVEQDGQGSTGFQRVKRLLPREQTIGLPVSVELDGDGRSDLLSGSLETGRVEVMWSNGGGQYSAPITLGQCASVRSELVVEDVDVAPSGFPFDVHFFTSEGGRVFTTSQSLPPNAGVHIQIQFGDLDGDADPDVLTRTINNARMVFLNQQGVYVGAPQTWGMAPRPDSSAIVDLDGDGDSDLVQACWSPPSVLVVIKEDLGGGTFASNIQTSVPGRRPVIRDVDLDGVPDLLVLDQFAQKPRFHRSNGLLGLDPVADLTQESVPAFRDVQLADMDGEVWSTAAGGTEMADNSDGQGTFAAPVQLTTAGGLGESLVVSDQVYGPGPDLTYVLAGDVQIRGDTATLAYEPAAEVPSSYPNASSVLYADLDGDGDLDLLRTFERNNAVTWSPSESVSGPGASYCGPARENSLGRGAHIRAVGSASIAAASLELHASGVRPGALMLVFASRTPGYALLPGGSEGALCLGGAIGRYAGPNEVQTAAANGSASRTVDVTALPEPNSDVPAIIGETWRFQAWYRDLRSGGATSNFTDADAVTFVQ